MTSQVQTIIEKIVNIDRDNTNKYSFDVNIYIGTWKDKDSSYYHWFSSVLVT